jgi:hypothetical protein
VAFDLIDILSEICAAHGMHNATAFTIEFSERRLRALLDDVQATLLDKPSRWLSSRAQMYGSLDKPALVSHFAAFQVFHELGHFIEFLDARRAGRPFSVETEKDELACDEFASGELFSAYGDQPDLGFLESIHVSVFLSILIWTLAEHLPRLSDSTFRARTFEALIARAKTATLRLHQMDYRQEPPSERRQKAALRHLPIFQAVLDMLDTLFVEGLAKDAEMFDYQGRFIEGGLPTLPESMPVQHAVTTERPGTWESIWMEEDDREQKRAESLKRLL